MCHVMATKMQHSSSSEGDGSSTTDGDASTSPPIVAVVGAAHLPGIEYLWNTGKWQQMCPKDKPLSDADVMQSPEVTIDEMIKPGAGLKRGMLEAMMRLSVSGQVLYDIENHFPPLPESETEAYNWIMEMYGTNRMQLASLPKDLLQKIVDGYECDYWEQLQPLRQVRLMNGGPGYSPEIGMALRALNFEFQ